MLAGLSVSHRTLAEEKSLLHSSVVVLYAYTQAENRARERGETGRDEMRYSGEQSSLFKLNQERKKREGKPVEHQKIPVEVSFIANTKK